VIPCARLEKYPLDGASCYGCFLGEQISGILACENIFSVESIGLKQRVW
jgi:hypothetical protein